MSEKLRAPLASTHIKEFLWLFVHELRSPLSVLSNDLAYLTAKYQAEDLNNSKESIKRISEILSSVESCSNTQKESESSTVAELLDELSPFILSRTNEMDSSATFSIDLKSIKPHLTTLLAQIDSHTIRVHEHQQGLEISLTVSTTHSLAGGIFNALRFPLKAAASPTKLAFAELTLILSGILITTASDRLIIFLPYDSSQDTVSR